MELTLAYLELLFVIGRKTIGNEYSDKGGENTEEAWCKFTPLRKDLVRYINIFTE